MITAVIRVVYVGVKTESTEDAVYEGWVKKVDGGGDGGKI